MEPRPGAAAGHSGGETPAPAGVGVLRAEQAMVLVRERGKAMAAASAARPTSMTAVVGGQPDEVAEKIAAAGLTAANNNGSGQIVAAGTVAQMVELGPNPPGRWPPAAPSSLSVPRCAPGPAQRRRARENG